MHFGLIVREYNAPYPTAHGTAINTWSIMAALRNAGHAVTVFLISNTGSSRANELLDLGVGLRVLPHGNNWDVHSRDFSLRRPRQLLFPTMTTFYPWVALAPDMRRLLDEVRPDAVVAYTLADLSVTHGIEAYPRMAILVDLEHLVVHYRWRETPLRPVKAFIAATIRRLGFIRQPTFAKQLLATCDSVVNFAAHHASELRRRGIEHCQYIPPPTRDAVGPDWRQLRDSSPARARPRILLVGHLSGIATTSGLELFVSRVLPTLEKVLGSDQFEVHIVGDYAKNPALAERLAGANVVLRGYVEDVGQEFLACDVLLVPTPIDLGTRTRIIEGFSFGCCVVAHAANALGIPQMSNDDNSLLASDGDGIARCVVRAVKDGSLRARLGSSARRTFEEHFSLETAGARVTSELERIAARNRR